MRTKGNNISITLQVALLMGLFSTLLSAQTKTISATIDVSKTGAPISKNIYGQFLEHIGGIVNNGIWAEMLDDREFFYPITSHPACRTGHPFRVPSPRAAPLDANRPQRIRDDGFRSSLCRRAHAGGETEWKRSAWNPAGRTGGAQRGILHRPHYSGRHFWRECEGSAGVGRRR